jgi:hypothetical protein
VFDRVINAGAALVLELLEEARPWPLEELKIGLSAEAVLFSEAKRLLRCILKKGLIHSGLTADCSDEHWS